MDITTEETPFTEIRSLLEGFDDLLDSGPGEHDTLDLFKNKLVNQLAMVSAKVNALTDDDLDFEYFEDED